MPRESAPWGADVIRAIKEGLGLNVPINSASASIDSDNWMILDLRVILTTAQWRDILDLVVQYETRSEVNREEVR